MNAEYITKRYISQVVKEQSQKLLEGQKVWLFSHEGDKSRALQNLREIHQKAVQVINELGSNASVRFLPELHINQYQTPNLNFEKMESKAKTSFEKLKIQFWNSINSRPPSDSESD